MNAKDLRSKYIEFFESKGHMRHGSAPLIPIDVTGKLDETLLFTGAGMVQFKPYFRGIATPPSRRIVTSQKCVRAVDIEEVGNPSHLTFFEMLGNFSFGDYFKEDAIEYAWEFLFSPQWLGLDKQKVCVTVFEEDEDAFRLWETLWKNAGYDPSLKIVRLGEDKNFWPAGSLSNGPPGPCGPCSEIFYQTAPDHEMTGDYLVDEAAGRWLEIWNLVFMQYEWKGHLRDPDKPHLGFVKDGMDFLPQHNIDTGMGLDRTAAVLSGFPSVYETDVFEPIVERIVELSGRSGISALSSDELRAVRVIADHARTASFCIADGILPSNTGRGYVLRRLIRRSVLKGQRTLSIQKPFMALVFPAVLQALSDPYLELIERSDTIVQTLQQEEQSFLRTMQDGYARFEALLLEKGTLSGKDAFYLYDTFGFPFEVTHELAAERNIEVSYDEFHSCMLEAQERSRAAQGATDVFGGAEEPLVLVSADYAQPTTAFVGYQDIAIQTRISQISPRFGKDGLTTGHFQICLEETPFYAEAGGQVGDTGRITSESFEFEVTNTWREMGLIWHDCVLKRIDSKALGLESAAGLERKQITEKLRSGLFFLPVIAEVDAKRRRRITRNHTATHLLHAALRKVLGNHVTQAGSLVAPDRLRFDFTHGQAMTPSELEQVERIVNEQIETATVVVIQDGVPLSVARNRGAMMLFGEKYGDFVRVVEIPGFSLELCGGCHVPVTDEIGLFKITSESSSASGVRRIEAVTSLGAYEWALEQVKLLQEISLSLRVPIRDAIKAIAKLKERTTKAKTEVSDSNIQPQSIGTINLYLSELRDVELDTAKMLVDRIIEKDSSGVGLLAIVSNGKATFLCKAGKKAIAQGAHAGNLVREVATAAGGSGGGRQDFAQAGTKETSRIAEALDMAKHFVAQQVNG